MEAEAEVAEAVVAEAGNLRLGASSLVSVAASVATSVAALI